MNYNDMIRTVAGATGLTRSEADAAVVTTLTVLAEVLPPDETRDLLAQLPKTVRERVPVNSEPLTMRPIEFVARVADLGTISIEDAERDIRATFVVLTDAVNAGEMNDVAEHLGAEFADVMGRSERLARERSAARGDTNVLSLAVGAALSVLHFGAHLVRGPLDAGLRAAGMKH
jgi:uncharacterized protein (DUF2267 family)